MEYRYVNRRISELFGLPADNIIGKRDEAFFDAGSASEIKQMDRSVLASGKKVTVEESSVLQGESRVRTFLSIKMPLSMSPGKITLRQQVLVNKAQVLFKLRR